MIGDVEDSRLGVEQRFAHVERDLDDDGLGVLLEAEEELALDADRRRAETQAFLGAGQLARPRADVIERHARNRRHATRKMRAVGGNAMIRKLKSGEYRLYSRKKNPKTGRRRNLGTFSTRAAAEKHERAVQFFKRH